MWPNMLSFVELTTYSIRLKRLRQETFANSNIGVFVGVEPSGLERKEASVFSASGGSSSVTSGRLSFSLGLVGPCYSIDVACASSLAALHTCIMTIKGGDSCEEGLGIGTKVLSEAVNYATSVAGMTSARGRCHTFDQRADGYCRGEGCGAFLLRSTASSGVEVLGSAVQQDGPSASLTAPNGSSQRRLIESVSRTIPTMNGNLSLEAHGTGTALGDPIEVGSLAAAVLAERGAGSALALGGVKGNLGHTESTAGATGMLALMLGLQHGEAAPNPQLRQQPQRLDPQEEEARLRRQRPASRRTASVCNLKTL